jgi:glycerol-3-phosphate dehydrogenase (NAD(P)+)
VSRRICVVGTGAWGTALAHVARTAGHEVRIWSRGNPDADAVRWAGGIILAVPAQHVRETLGKIAFGPQPVIIAAKGIERGSGMLMAEVVSDCVPTCVPLVLSGPSFAADVLRDLPTAVTLAADNIEVAGRWAEMLALPTFRIYHSNDVRGVEIGGAMKNVLAIACGISDGYGLGNSARAALTTRGFAELLRFGQALGARRETLMGLSGLGDLLLTCSSPQSRNYGFGFAIGKGASAADALAAARGVVEGQATAAIAMTLARQHGIDMPITEQVHAIIEGRVAPADAIRNLLSRPTAGEFN